jgi:hypothetical protein
MVLGFELRAFVLDRQELYPQPTFQGFKFLGGCGRVLAWYT